MELRFAGSSWMAVALTVVAACASTGNDGTSTGGGNTSVCDGKSSCDTCLECARQNPCQAEVSRCQADSDCVYLDSCVTGCGANVACRSGCTSSNAGAVSKYNALRNCLYCEQCPDDCAGFQTCS